MLSLTLSVLSILRHPPPSSCEISVPSIFLRHLHRYILLLNIISLVFSTKENPKTYISFPPYFPYSCMYFSKINEISKFSTMCSLYIYSFTPYIF